MLFHFGEVVPLVRRVVPQHAVLGLETREAKLVDESILGRHGGSVAEGQGLALVQSRCLKKGSYTVYIKASLDKTTGYKRIMNSEGWVDHGFYVNKYFMSFPKSGGLTCPEKIRPGKTYQYVITRSTGGKVTIYLNGYPCAAKKVAYDEQLKEANPLAFPEKTGIAAPQDISNSLEPTDRKSVV